MMKVWLLKDETVIIENGNAAKIFDAAPSGIYEGVDLCADDAAEQLREKFQELSDSGNLNDFDDIYSSNEIAFEELSEELEDAELVFES